MAGCKFIGRSAQRCMEFIVNPKSLYLAVADYVDGNGECPDELEAAFDAQEFNIAPNVGGRDEQPAGQLRRMRVALNVYRAWSAWKRRPAGSKDLIDWIKNHPEYSIVKHVQEIRRGG